MKKRKIPIRKTPLQVYGGTLYNYEEHPIIDYATVSNQELENQNEYRIILDSCNLSNIAFINNSFLRTEFIDCIFKNCDFSNNSFINTSFVRCEFIGCKFIGARIDKSLINNVLFEDSNLTLLDLGNNTLEHVDIFNSNLKESNWFENKVKGLNLKDNYLQKAVIYNSSFKDVDVSTSNIEGLNIDQLSLKGIIISSYQAQEFCHILGIKVID